ncbi:MAG: cysteine-rich small domain-containing protein [Firmicutes bacterium]|nr:cysteine-rich small domain-containing protein [Bacillota bacterium]
MEKYKFFNHKECECFPCHNVSNEDDFNCLFCYCPLYTLGDKCGGNFKYLENGIKDCSNCMVPHSKNAYDYIMSKCEALMEMAKKK